MVVVEVGVESGPDGNSGCEAESVELEGGACRGVEPFYQEACVSADEEAAVAGGLRTFGGVGDGGVDARPNLADGGETAIDERGARNS